MDNLRIFSENKLQTLRYEDYNIINIDNLKKDTDYKLYATGDYTISCGRRYVAIPANQYITQDLINKYNIMK